MDRCGRGTSVRANLRACACTCVHVCTLVKMRRRLNQPFVLDQNPSGASPASFLPIPSKKIEEDRATFSQHSPLCSLVRRGQIKKMIIGFCVVAKLELGAKETCSSTSVNDGGHLLVVLSVAVIGILFSQRLAIRVDSDGAPRIFDARGFV